MKLGPQRKLEPQDFPRFCENYPGGSYSDEEREFLVAVDRYKHEHKRKFPALKELFHLMLQLGYRKCETPPLVVTTETTTNDV